MLGFCFFIFLQISFIYSTVINPYAPPNPSVSGLALPVACSVYKRTVTFCLFICLCAGIKKYVVGLIIKTSSDATSVEVSGAARIGPMHIDRVCFSFSLIFLEFLLVTLFLCDIAEREGIHRKAEYDPGAGKVYLSYIFVIDL